MNDYVAELTLDLDCRNTLPIVRAGQYDKGRKILVHVTANDHAYSAAGCLAVIKGKRRDKTYFSESCEVDNSGNVEVTLDEAILAVPGFAYSKIVLTDSARNYSTQVFIVDVDNSLEGNITEIESFSILNDCLNQLASLFGLDNAQQILTQYLTIDDIISSVASAASDKIFSSEYMINNYVPKTFTFAGLSLNQNRSPWTVTDALLSGIIALGTTDKAATEIFNGTAAELPYHEGTLFINTVNHKGWVCTAIDSASGNPPYTFHWIPLDGKIPTKISELSNDGIYRRLGYISEASSYTPVTYSGVSGAKPDFVVGDVVIMNGVLWRVTAVAEQVGGGWSYTLSSIGLATSKLYNDAGFLTSQDISDKMDHVITVPVTVDADHDSTEDVPMGQVFRYNGEYYVKSSLATPVSAQDQFAAHNDIPTATSDLTNDSGFLTAHQDISGKEDKSNKVTSLSAQSTDTQYPSAKCVFDAIPADISKISNAIINEEGYVKVYLSANSNMYPVRVSGSYYDPGVRKGDIIYNIATESFLRCTSFSSYEGIGGTRYNYTIHGLGLKTSSMINDSGFLTAHQDISGKVDKTRTVAGVDLQDDITASELKTALSVPTKTSDLTNDSGFLTAHQDISDKMDLVLSTVPANAAGTQPDMSSNEFVQLAIGQAFFCVLQGSQMLYIKTLSGSTAGAYRVTTSRTSQLANDSGFLTAHQDVSGKENSSNKVTSLSAQSTDTQYPSAKCVYDLIGDISNAFAEML